jgi:hypothetical protein
MALASAGRHRPCPRFDHPRVLLDVSESRADHDALDTTGGGQCGAFEP